jgi:hypothetical protein
MKNESSAHVMLGNVLGPAIMARAWSTYMVWLVDSLSIGRLLVTADVASVRALFVANLAVALADFVEDGAVSGYRDGYLRSSYSSSIHSLRLQRHCQGDVAAIGERRDDETTSVAHPLIKVFARKVTDLDIHIKSGLLPFEMKLLLPWKGVVMSKMIFVRSLGDNLPKTS